MENLINGLVLNQVPVPVEMLIEIFRNLDSQSLIRLQSVCQTWHDVIHRYIWHREAQKNFGQRIQYYNDIPWNVYYSMSRIVFGNNLIGPIPGLCKGQKRIQYRTAVWNMGIFRDEIPRYPRHISFRGHKYYFISGSDVRFQNVYLKETDYPTKFMDIIQPPIEVIVWFTCDVGANYMLNVALSREDYSHVRNEQFRTTRGTDYSREWRKIKFVFHNYGPGVRSIRVSDRGTKNKCKITGVSIKILQPTSIPTNYVEVFQPRT